MGVGDVGDVSARVSEVSRKVALPISYRDRLVTDGCKCLATMTYSPVYDYHLRFQTVPHTLYIRRRKN